MTKFHRYLFGLSTWARSVLAVAAGTSPRYLGQVARGERQASADLAGRIEVATMGAIKRSDICEACAKCPHIKRSSK